MDQKKTLAITVLANLHFSHLSQFVHCNFELLDICLTFLYSISCKVYSISPICLTYVQCNLVLFLGPAPHTSWTLPTGRHRTVNVTEFYYTKLYL